MDGHDAGEKLWVTQNIGNLGKLRQPSILKAWHTHGNRLPGGVDFYPLLAKVGKASSQGSRGFIASVHKVDHLNVSILAYVKSKSL